MPKLQVTGFVTIAKSNKLSDEQKQQVLQASPGKVRGIRAILVDSTGKEVIVQSRLGMSKSGSLTGRFAVKLDSFELIEMDESKSAEKQEDSVNDLAAQLLGQ
jgi:hypothetical protein